MYRDPKKIRNCFVKMNIQQLIENNLPVFNQDDFPGWIDDNHHVWEEFEKRALRVAAKGYKYFSSKCLFEVIRYHTAISEKDTTFKLNNNFTGDIARLFMLVHPELNNFFEIRNKAA